MVITASSVHATETSQLDLCKDIGKIANQIMQIRQAETPFTQTMAIAKDNKMLQAITTSAYKVIAMQTPNNQIKQRLQFQNKWEMSCMSAK